MREPRVGPVLAALLSVTLLPAAAPAARDVSEQPEPRSSRLLFVANEGQFDAAVRYQARVGGATVWLTDDALWLSYFDRAKRTGRGVNLELTFAGTNPGARLVPIDPQPARMNYFLGNDRGRWRSDVATFGAVRWTGLYRGITLELSEVNGGLALIVDAEPGADLGSLQMQVRGADAVRGRPDRQLIAETPLGELPLPPLLRDRVTRGVTRADSGLLYGTYLGGADDDRASDIALGVDRSIYVAGWTSSPDFPTTPGAFDTTNNDSRDAFVSKLDPTGSSLVYGTFLGGTDIDTGLALAVDPGGAVHVAGYAYSQDFPTTPGSFSPDWNGGCCDGFVTKLNESGSDLVYSTFLGGILFDRIDALALGPDGVAHVTGETISWDFPTTPGAHDRTWNDGSGRQYSDAFVTALNASGSDLVHSTFLGGRANESGWGIALDSAGAPYVTGLTHSVDFPTTRRAFDRRYHGGPAGDAFATKLTPTAGAVRFSTYLGGNGSDKGSAIVVDDRGAAYVVGATDSPDFPVTPAAYDTTINGRTDAFATKLTPRGRSLRYSTFLGGSDFDRGEHATLAEGRTLALTGRTQSPNLPTTPDAFDGSLGGTVDALVARLDAAGSSLLYGTFLGGTGTVYESGLGIASAGGTAVYAAGYAFSSDFPTTPGAFDTTYNGDFDAFVVALVTGP